MTQEMQAKLRELLQDEDFSNKVIMATSYEEEVAILKEYGIEISEEELRSYGEEGMAHLKEEGYISEDGELSPEMLEQVAGGKSAGLRLIGGGVGMMGLALASDYLAGVCAVALVSNPLGWFVGGMAVCLAGGYVLSKEIKKKKKR